jgi:hypothetical protein
MYDDSDKTQFDPNPLGGRQRLLPKRTFKAVASVIVQAAPVPTLAELPLFKGRLVEAPAFGDPLALPPLPLARREVDISTVRVPKLPLHPNAFGSRLTMLSIAGLLALVIISILATRSDGVRLEAAAISATLGGETIDATVQGVADVEQPPVEITIDAPIVHRVAKLHLKRMTKRPQLAVDVSTPLGDLAKRR